MELESGADSVTSTPRSVSHHKTAEDRAVVRLMCSFGGKILPRPHDNQLRYVGGDTRIVAVNRSTTFSALLSKLSKLLPTAGAAEEGFTVKYQLPNEDLDALITVSTDEDVENMMEEFDRLNLQSSGNINTSRIPRLRLFLFPNNGDEDSRTSSIASLLDGSRKRENWFLDALNGGVGVGGGGVLERGRSEASSIVSEVPDYLFGLDNSDDAPRMKNRLGFVEPVSGSNPGSPFGSTSSAPPMPNLPPVKTKPVNPVEDTAGQAVQYTVGYAGGPVWSQNTHPTPNPGSPYPGHTHTMQAIPVYYVPSGPGPGPVPRANAHMQPVSLPVPGQYIQQYGAGPGGGQAHAPLMYPGSGPVRPVSVVDPYEMQMQGNVVHAPSGPGQPGYYGVKNAGTCGMVGPFPGMVVPVKADEARGPGSDPNKARSLPA